MKHITQAERIIIEKMLKEHYTQQKIAECIGKSQQAISAEIRRHSVSGKYSAEMGYYRTKEKLSQRKNYTKYTIELAEQIAYYIKLGWSPYVIANGTDLDVSHKTIYRWIDEGLIPDISRRSLIRKGKKSKKKQAEKRHRFGDEERSIEKRPEEANNRERYGDWEVDTVVSSHNTYCVVTVVDRKTRFLKAKIVPNRTASVVAKAVTKLLKDEVVHTITADNGSEFANYEEIEKKLGAKMYFCHVYSSWERGSNEHSNGLIRRAFPKKTDFKKIRQRTLDRVIKNINNRPKEITNWLTPLEMKMLC